MIVLDIQNISELDNDKNWELKFKKAVHDYLELTAVVGEVHDIVISRQLVEDTVVDESCEDIDDLYYLTCVECVTTYDINNYIIKLIRESDQEWYNFLDEYSYHPSWYDYLTIPKPVAICYILTLFGGLGAIILGGLTTMKKDEL